MQPRRRNRLILGLLALGLLAGGALTAPPAQAVDAVGPYYAEPAWDQQLAAATRFVVLTNWSSQAVLDKETGLVWARTPSSGPFSWDGARAHCLASTTGNHQGWRLPSVHELASLIDPLRVGPALPLGHPFLNVSFSLTATTNAGYPDIVWYVDFSNGNGVVSTTTKTGPAPAWCVRGGMNAAAY